MTHFGLQSAFVELENLSSQMAKAGQGEYFSKYSSQSWGFTLFQCHQWESHYKWLPIDTPKITQEKSQGLFQISKSVMSHR